MPVNKSIVSTHADTQICMFAGWVSPWAPIRGIKRDRQRTTSKAAHRASPKHNPGQARLFHPHCGRGVPGGRATKHELPHSGASLHHAPNG
jgi:hypothetical protein